VYQHAEDETFEPASVEPLAKCGDEAREKFPMIWLAASLLWRYKTSYRQ
jgi:hypothetical protein